MNPSDWLPLLTPGSGGDTDDGGVQASRPISSPFFGLPQLVAPLISTNGVLYFEEANIGNDYQPYNLGTLDYPIVAAFWQDLSLGANGRILENAYTPGFYAVTWENVEVGEGYLPEGAGATGSFQVVFVESDMELNGVNLLAGDILFTFDVNDLYEALPEVVIGLQLDSISTAYAPDSFVWHLDGTYMYGFTSEFQVGADEYLLFRANGDAYDSSIGTFTPVPEPGVSAALLSGALLLGWRTWRRRVA